MSLTLIVAQASNRCIGKDGGLPWHIPEDLKHFRQCTMGKTVLMGRKTWESLPEKHRPLSGRKNVVITRDRSFKAEGAILFHDLEEALKTLKDDDIWVIGGAEIFKYCLPFAQRIELTQIDTPYDGDTFFPEISPQTWSIAKEEKHDGYSFITYSRI